MSGPITVIAIVGRAYTGSTLLGSLLEELPGVFHGGELQRLANHEAARCGSCATDCPVWVGESVEGHGRDLPMYERIADLTGATTIVDGSKRPIHFRERIAAAEPVRWIVVMTRKHPLRLLASILTKRVSEPDALRCPTPDIEHTASAVIDKLTRFEHQRDTFLSEHGDRFDAAATLSYESLASHPRPALRSVAEMASLRDSQPEHPTVTGHSLGGNWAFHDRSRRQERTIQVDNRYQSVFGQDLTNWLMQDPGYLELCRITGYGPIPT